LKKLNEADVVKLLRKKFGKDKVHRLTGLRIRGIPDVLISIEEIAFFLEIKIDGEKLTATQKVFIKIFEKSSGCININNESSTYYFSGPRKFKKYFDYLNLKGYVNED